MHLLSRPRATGVQAEWGVVFLTRENNSVTGKQKFAHMLLSIRKMAWNMLGSTLRKKKKLRSPGSYLNSSSVDKSLMQDKLRVWICRVFDMFGNRVHAHKSIPED
jgi:hypothetical protein